MMVFRVILQQELIPPTFMGKGAFARNDGMPQHLVGVETDRQKLKALNILINRRALVMHPNGLSWNANAALTGGKSTQQMQILRNQQTGL